MTIGTRFAFTLANPTSKSLAKLQSLDKLNFLIYSSERTPNGQLRHLQGYLELNTETNAFKLKHLLGGDFFIGVARESREVNIKYCTKSNIRVYIKTLDKKYYYPTFPDLLDKIETLNYTYFRPLGGRGDCALSLAE